MPSEQRVRIPVPHARGGASRQPAHLRHANQAEEVQNANISVVDGTSKRPGSLYTAKVSSLTSAGNYRMHTIERDGVERYIIVYGDVSGTMTIRAWEVDADYDLLEANFTIDTAAQTYLDNGNPTADDMRFVTQGDTTIVTNTKVATGLTSTDDYAISATRPTFDILSSVTLNAGKFGRVRPTNDDENDKSEYYRYLNTGDPTFGRGQFSVVSGNTATSWGAATGKWKQGSKRTMGFKVGMARLNMDITAGAWTTATKTLTKSAAFTNYTFRDGDAILITGGTNVTTGWYPIASKTSADAIVLEDEITTGSTNEVDVTSDAIGGEFEVIADFTNFIDADTTMHDIAKQLEKALRDAGADDALIAWSFKQGSDRGRFTITCPWRGSGTKVFQPTAPSDTTTNESLVASGAPFETITITEGTGSPTTDTLDPALRWTKIAAPGEANAVPDSTKMPVAMTVTSFTGNGSTPAEFAIDPITWNNRVSGDDITNPPVSILANADKIADVSFFDNRMAIAGGENVVFSAAGDYFNFWLEDAENLVDSDPIDKTMGSESVTLMEFLVQFRKGMIAFTKAGRQFALSEPDVLNQSSAKWTQASTHRTIANVRPKTMGNRLYFVGPRQDEGVLYEFTFDETSLENIAIEQTVHVAGLIPVDVRTVATDANNSVIFVMPESCEKIYVYQPWWNGNEKVNSAWNTWIFDASYVINDIVTLENQLFMLVESASQYFFERIPIARQALQ